MKSLKLSVGFNAFFFGFVGMLLTGFLVSVFWYCDVVYRESRGVERYLNRLVREQRLQGLDTGGDARGRAMDAALDRLSRELGAGCRVNSLLQDAMFTGERCSSRFREVVDKVGNTTGAVSELSEILPPAVSSAGQGHIVVGFRSNQGRPSVIGLSLPRSYFLRDILHKQRTIIVYLIVNGIILAVVVFFRLSRSILRPLDRLVTLAKSYEGGEPELNVKGAGGEIGQLTSAMRSMLSRIEKDREHLRSNIKQLVQANQELKHTRREMVRTEKMAATGRLAAGLGHEIGNPIGIISGYLELIKKEDIPPEEKIDYLSRAESELERVHTLVRQLVDCGRRSSGPLVDVDLVPVIREVVEMMEHNTSAQKITFSMSCESEHAVVVARPENLKQVLLNCLFNSIDAVGEKADGRAGKIQVLVRDAALGEDRYLCLEIVDNGPGVSPEQLHEVFDPFYTTKAPGVGTGLGLTVSQSIIEGFHGRMEFESTPGEGSTMKICLPAAGGTGEYKGE